MANGQRRRLRREGNAPAAVARRRRGCTVPRVGRGLREPCNGRARCRRCERRQCDP